MGISASSLLDETKSNYIKGQAEAELKAFSPYYRKQFSVARFSQVEEDLEQNKEKITQLLKQREAPEEAEVLYEEGVLYFDETRKWRERYVVVRANYCLECHDGLETFVKGVPPRQKLLPTGGAVLTTEEKYMAMVDKCFPDDSAVKEDFAPPLSGMPGQFPVYLRLPYRRDSYFCFRQQAKQDAFLSILSDCIRHQNQDFLKKKTCEVQAFLKAIQLYRQDKGRYESWDMLIGSDVRVLANLVMEQLLPSLEKDMLPRLKAKKTEKKRVWFATVEAAYILVQEHLLEGLSALKEECRTSVRQQEVQIHSDMDQILESRRQLEEKIRAKVSEPAEKLCSESVQPYLGSVLEELMEPISSGFLEGRQLSEAMMDQVCRDVQEQGDEQLKKALANMARPNPLSCYQKISSLQEKLQHLQERFSFSNITEVIHSAQIDLQQLMENAAFTFEQLLQKAVQDNPDNAGSAIEKAKHRVLKQYDYDSSTARKRISGEALVSITLPFIKKNLEPTCKTELQGLDQSIYTDHTNFIHVENVYESFLLQTLDKEVTKVVKEAASLKKYNLFTDSRDLLSQSSRSSLSSPSVSTPNSPAMTLASPTSKTSSEPQPPSPLAVNGQLSTPEKKEQQKEVDAVPQSEAATDVTVIKTPLGEVEQKVAEPPAPEAEEVFTTVTPVALETPEVIMEAAPQTVTQEEVKVETAAEPQTQSKDAPEEAEITLSETPTVVEHLKTEVEEVTAQIEAPESAEEAENSSAEAPESAKEAENSSAEAPESAEEAENSSAEAPESAEEAENSSAEAPESAEEAENSSAEAPESAEEAENSSAEAPESAEEAENTSAEAPDSTKEAENTSAEAPGSAEEPENAPAEGTDCQAVSSCEVETQSQSSESSVEAPPCGETPALTSADLKDAEPVSVSDPNSLDVSVGSESAPSDIESTEEAKVTPSSEDEVSTTSDVLDQDVDLSKSPVSSDDPAEERTTSVEPPPPPPQTEAPSEDIEAGASVTSESSEPVREETPSSPEAPPLDSIKEIRDLVVEVIEVEELVQHYPDGVPKEE